MKIMNSLQYSKTCEYLIPSNTIIVLLWRFDLTKNLISFVGFSTI